LPELVEGMRNFMDTDTDKKVPEISSQVAKPKTSYLSLAMKIVSALILILVILGLAIYRFSWRGPVMELVIDVIPYPAVVVDYHIVPLGQYFLRYQAVKSAFEYNQDLEFEDPGNKELVDEARQQIMEELVRTSYIKKLANQRGINATSEDIDRETAVILQQTGNDRELMEVTLKNVYGWSFADFVSVIIRTQVLEDKLRISFVEDDAINAEAKQKASDILQRIKNGENFEAVAAETSDDTSNRLVGGDLGWVPQGYFVPEFEQAVFAMEVGDEPLVIPSRYGYHIVDLIDKTEEDGQVVVHPRHILIGAADFDAWLNERIDNAQIWRFPVL